MRGRFDQQREMLRNSPSCGSAQKSRHKEDEESRVEVEKPGSQHKEGLGQLVFCLNPFAHDGRSQLKYLLHKKEQQQKWPKLKPEYRTFVQSDHHHC